MNDFKEITAVILAAGDSSRLWPLGDKLLVSFNGQPLIMYTINQLRSLGIRRFIIVASAENYENLSKLTGDATVNITLAVQENRLGMAGAVLAAVPLLKTAEVLIIGPTDIVETHLYSAFVQNYRKKPDGIMVAKKLSEYQPLGYYSVEDGRVTGIIEKPGKNYTENLLAAIVFDYFRDASKLVEAIRTSKSSKDDLYEIAKLKMINKGAVFSLLTYNGYWGILKYPWHLLGLKSYFLSKISRQIKSTAIDPSAVISGPVLIEENVTILENVKIVVPAIISRGTLIGQNSLIRDSVIGQNAIIGNATEITRSFVGNNCWFHHNYIGDSVIMDGVAFGYGACTANYRLDGTNIKTAIGNEQQDTGRTKLGAIVGKYARIGVNVALMPGVKVGANSFVGSSVTLSQDLPDGKYIEITKTSFKISDNRVKKPGNSIETNRSVLKI